MDDFLVCFAAYIGDAKFGDYNIPQMPWYRHMAIIPDDAGGFSLAGFPGAAQIEN